MSNSDTRTTVQIAIGNTDNHLTQQEWSQFYWSVDLLIREIGGDEHDVAMHFAGSTATTAPYQTAMWSFDRGSIPQEEWRGYMGARHRLLNGLAALCEEYDQQGIAWNESVPTFVTRDGVAIDFGNLRKATEA